MFKIRRDDIVQVIKGKDTGKKGKVLKVFPQANKALVEGVNFAKKHRRQTQQTQQGGIVSIEMPLSIANLMFFCNRCNQTARIGFKLLTDGKKVRFCKGCNEVI